MSRPAPHFSWREFACHEGTPYPTTWRTTRAVALAAVLEGFRTFLGGGLLHVGSVYRTPAWNRAHGGAPNSQHPQGRAADSYPPVPVGKRRRMTMRTFHVHAQAYARSDRRVGGLGLYRWGVHLDTRTRKNGRLVVWNQVPAGTRMHDRPG